MICDEFTTRKDLTDNQKYRLRHLRDGLCACCPQPATQGNYCAKHGHHKEKAEKSRESWRKFIKENRWAIKKMYWEFLNNCGLLVKDWSIKGFLRDNRGYIRKEIKGTKTKFAIVDYDRILAEYDDEDMAKRVCAVLNEYPPPWKYRKGACFHVEKIAVRKT